MSLAQGNNTPTRPRIEPGSPDPESDALTTRPVRPPIKDPVYEDFLEMARSELEDFLAPRYLSCTGSKRELVARAFTAWELQLPVKVSYEELQTKLRVEYDRRLTVHGIRDPKTYTEDAWKKGVLQWPPLDLGKLFEYIL